MFTDKKPVETQVPVGLFRRSKYKKQIGRSKVLTVGRPRGLPVEVEVVGCRVGVEGRRETGRAGAALRGGRGWRRGGRRRRRVGALGARHFAYAGQGAPAAAPVRAVPVVTAHEVRLGAHGGREGRSRAPRRPTLAAL